MSKLEELIQKLCPNGVEYKRFDEACTLNARIGWQRLTKAEYKSSGEYLLITGTDFTSSYEVNYSSCVYVSEERYLQDKKIQIKNGDVLITKDGTLGKVAQVSNLSMPATLNGGVFVVRPKDESLLPRYIMYFLLSGHFQKVVDQQKTGSTISHLTQALFSRLQLPVPPLEVQREIVRVLDYFTLLTAELTDKLMAEFTARKKQYEFYRDRLLTFDPLGGGEISEIAWKKLGEICDIISGFPFDSTQFCNSGVKLLRGMNVKRGFLDFSDSNNKYWRSIDGVEKYLLRDGDIIVAMDGSLVGKSFGIVSEKQLPLLLVQRVARVRAIQGNVRYIYHCISGRFSNYVDIKKTEGAVPHISLKDILNFQIPFPELQIQNRIAHVLDNFNAICTDLNIGLPAEIEDRQKQYEYYRDKLLSFKEVSESIGK